MNKYFLIMISAILLLACNQTTHNPMANTLEGHSHATLEAEEEHKAEIGHTLGLNNGAKWQSDENTNRNVSKLQAIITGFKKLKSPQAIDYRQAGSLLSEGLSTMTKECKMQGANHEALHLWLHPLSKEVIQLEKVKDTAYGKDIFNAIDTRLKVYKNYFE